MEAVEETNCENKKTRKREKFEESALKSAWIKICHNQNGVKRDALSSLLFNFVLEYTIRKDQENQKGMEINGTYQVVVYDMLIYWMKIKIP